MIVTYLKIITILLFSIYASIKDIKTMKVSDRLNIIFACFGILFIMLQNRLDYIIIAIITFYALFLFVNFLGGGDLKFLAALSLYIGPAVIQVIGIYCAISLIKRYLLKVKGTYPAMPDITISIVICLLRIGSYL